MTTIANRDVLAESANPLVGQWTVGDRDTCKAPGDSDEARITIRPRRIILYEGFCDIRSMRKTSRLHDSAYQLRVACTEEGQRRRTEILLAVTRQTTFHDEILVRVDRDTGVVFTYQRCLEPRHRAAFRPIRRRRARPACGPAPARWTRIGSRFF